MEEKNEQLDEEVEQIKKSKKPRSEKQVESFKKAQQIRLEKSKLKETKS